MLVYTYPNYNLPLSSDTAHGEGFKGSSDLRITKDLFFLSMLVGNLSLRSDSLFKIILSINSLILMASPSLFQCNDLIFFSTFSSIFIFFCGGWGLTSSRGSSGITFEKNKKDSFSRLCLFLKDFFFQKLKEKMILKKKQKFWASICKFRYRNLIIKAHICFICDVHYVKPNYVSDLKITHTHDVPCANNTTSGATLSVN